MNRSDRHGSRYDDGRDSDGTAHPPSAILRGFANPVTDQQRVFRAILTALSEPGRAVPCPVFPLDAPMVPTMAAVALTLLDFETPILLGGRLRSDEKVTGYLTFHTGAPIVTSDLAAFAFFETPGELLDLNDFQCGTPEYPDRSATVIVGVESFGEGIPVMLTGPGIKDKTGFSAAGLERAFWTAAIRNAARFPLGIDFIFCTMDTMAALPRSAVIELDACLIPADEENVPYVRSG